MDLLKKINDVLIGIDLSHLDVAVLVRHKHEGEGKAEEHVHWLSGGQSLQQFLIHFLKYEHTSTEYSSQPKHIQDKSIIDSTYACVASPHSTSEPLDPQQKKQESSVSIADEDAQSACSSLSEPRHQAKRSLSHAATNASSLVPEKTLLFHDLELLEPSKKSRKTSVTPEITVTSTELLRNRSNSSTPVVHVKTDVSDPQNNNRAMQSESSHSAGSVYVPSGVNSFKALDAALRDSFCSQGRKASIYLSSRLFKKTKENDDVRNALWSQVFGETPRECCAKRPRLFKDRTDKMYQLNQSIYHLRCSSCWRKLYTVSTSDASWNLIQALFPEMQSVPPTQPSKRIQPTGLNQSQLAIEEIIEDGKALTLASCWKEAFGSSQHSCCYQKLRVGYRLLDSLYVVCCPICAKFLFSSTWEKTTKLRENYPSVFTGAAKRFLAQKPDCNPSVTDAFKTAWQNAFSWTSRPFCCDKLKLLDVDFRMYGRYFIAKCSKCTRMSQTTWLRASSLRKDFPFVFTKEARLYIDNAFPKNDHVVPSSVWNKELKGVPQTCKKCVIGLGHHILIRLNQPPTLKQQEPLLNVFDVCCFNCSNISATVTLGNDSVILRDFGEIVTCAKSDIPGRETEVAESVAAEQGEYVPALRVEGGDLDLPRSLTPPDPSQSHSDDNSNNNRSSLANTSISRRVMLNSRFNPNSVVCSNTLKHSMPMLRRLWRETDACKIYKCPKCLSKMWIMKNGMKKLIRSFADRNPGLPIGSTDVVRTPRTNQTPVVSSPVLSIGSTDDVLGTITNQPPVNAVVVGKTEEAPPAPVLQYNFDSDMLQVKDEPVY